MELYERIKQLRKQLNKTQEEFSRDINISRSNLGNIETGKISVTDRVLNDICRCYNVDIIWLETGEGEMFHKMTLDEEVAAFVGEILNKNSDPFKRRLLYALSRMDEEGWQKTKLFLEFLKEAESKEKAED